MQKQKTPQLNRDIRKEVLKKSVGEYEKDLMSIMRETKREFDKAKERSIQIKVKLAQFEQLLRNVSATERQRYSEQVNELFNPTDPGGSLERIIQYVDSIFEKKH